MVSSDSLRAAIERLAEIDRASCSRGEREAAEWIASALRASGARSWIERERVHGTYWWPLGISSALGVLGALATCRGRRMAGAVAAGIAAGAVLDDLGAGRRLLRGMLPKQLTDNVVAEAGDSEASETLLLVAHHDAAHTGLFFDPRITSFVAEHFQPKPGTPPRLPPVMASIAAAPALVAAGAILGVRGLVLLGGSISAVIGGSLADVALRRTVPGANDNLTGVAVLLGVAGALHDRPVDGIRVMLVSTGSEEALMDGMRAFACRHFRTLEPQHTRVICIDTVGSPHLVLAEAEGMIRVRPHDPELKERIASCAEAARIALRRGFTMRLGTDGYLALRHGFRTALLTSIDDHGAPSNYHWPTDTPDRLDFARVDDTVRLCEAVIRSLGSAGERLGEPREELTYAAQPAHQRSAGDP
jgi:hypothetical protein